MNLLLLIIKNNQSRNLDKLVINFYGELVAPSTFVLHFGNWWNLIKSVNFLSAIMWFSFISSSSKIVKPILTEAWCAYSFRALSPKVRIFFCKSKKWRWPSKQSVRGILVNRSWNYLNGWKSKAKLSRAHPQLFVNR